MKNICTVLTGILLLAQSVAAKVRTVVPSLILENSKIVVTIKNFNSAKDPFKAVLSIDGQEVNLESRLRSKGRRADIYFPDLVLDDVREVYALLTLSGKGNVQETPVVIVNENFVDLAGKDGQDGAVGPMGPQGVPGVQGPAGPKGDTGKDGLGFREGQVVRLHNPTTVEEALVATKDNVVINRLSVGGEYLGVWRNALRTDPIQIYRDSSNPNNTALIIEVGDDFGSSSLNDILKIGAQEHQTDTFRSVLEVDSSNKVRIPKLKEGLKNKKVLTTDDDGNIILVDVEDIL